MTDEPNDGMMPPGPPPTGGLSADDLVAARQSEAARQNPYVAAPLVPAQPAWREFDRMSFAAFLLALTWVGAPVAAVLGFLGMRRTEDRARVGRWAAVCGVVLGLIGTLGLVAGVAGVVWIRDNIKGVDRVEAGECVDVDDADGVSFDIRDCDEPHRAEVVAAGDLDDQTFPIYLGDSAAEFCFDQLDEHYERAARTGRYLVTVVIGAPDPDRPEVGDAFACYFERADGRSLTEAIDTTRRGNV